MDTSPTNITKPILNVSCFIKQEIIEAAPSEEPIKIEHIEVLDIKALPIKTDLDLSDNKMFIKSETLNEEYDIKDETTSNFVQKLYQCSLCEHKTAYKSTLNRHMKSHTGEKPFKCNVCDYKTIRKAYLEDHMKTHTGEKPLECKICAYRTVQRSNLTRHMKIHSSEKPFTCNLCPYRTAQKINLDNHIRTHIGNKPFHCIECGHSTATKRALIRHAKIRSGEKPFQCEVCEYRTVWKCHLVQHMKTHNGETPFQCNLFQKFSHLNESMTTTMTIQPQNKKKVSYYYDKDVGNYFYGEGHLMKPNRIQMTHNLILNYGIYRFMKILNPPKASSIEMTKFHADSYIKLLRVIHPENMSKHVKRMHRFNVGGDCPVFGGLYEFCQLSSGGSLAAAAQLNKKNSDICINWAGGLHHAKKARASGFCYVNDVVLAILELLKCHQRVLYVDIDVHHGDGVEEAFYTTDRVMTVSFHKFGEGYFPGTGALNDIGANKGKYYAINVPLNDGMDDKTYESIFVPIMTRIMDTYQPHAVVLQCGADSLTGDRLGCFNLTLRGHGKCVEFIKRYNLPLLMLGGGGYTLRNVPRLWTYETSLALGVEIVNDIPYNDYLEYYGPDYKLHSSSNNMTNENTRKYLQDVKERVFENIRMLPHGPGIQLQTIPQIYNNFDDSDDDEEDKDERLTQRDKNNRISADNEFSDSEDEGFGGRRDGCSYKIKTRRKEDRIDLKLEREDLIDNTLTLPGPKQEGGEEDKDVTDCEMKPNHSIKIETVKEEEDDIKNVTLLQNC